MNRRIDLRSDTVTQPTEEMRRAMYEAEVGDDVLGEDPTVAELQHRAARKLGFEAAVFVPSGTMGNLVSCTVHCKHGDGPIVAETFSHINFFEKDTIELFTGRKIVPVEGVRGFPIVEKVSEMLRNPCALVCLENTHNHAGGVPLSQDQVRDIVKVAGESDVRVHVDGARIFNAAVALGVPPSLLVKGVDSVMFCLSKGLSAPVGSLVVGSDAFVAEARDVRDAVGGGMRQCGVLAAAGIVALETMVDRLGEDHARARKLAEGMSEIDGFSVEPEDVKTNIVMIRVKEGKAEEYARALARQGILTFCIDDYIRMVTHRHISDEDVGAVIHAASQVVKE